MIKNITTIGEWKKCFLFLCRTDKSTLAEPFECPLSMFVSILMVHNTLATGGGIWVLWDTQDSTQTCKRTCSAGNTITQTCKQACSAGAHYFGVNQFISVMQSSAKFQNL